MTDQSDSLNHRPNQGLRLEILQAIFRWRFAAVDVGKFNNYFAFYEHELSTLSLGQWSQLCPSSQIAVATHSDLLRALGVVQANANSAKKMIRRELCSEFAPAAEERVDRTLDLILRLWLMINVRDKTKSLQTLRTPVVVWGDDWNLYQLLKETFPVSESVLAARESRLHPSFTVVFMIEVCGVRLEWTDCLADHLRLDRRTRVLRIFPYKVFLQSHLLSISEHHEEDNL